MPIATREAQVVWEGPLATGAGTVSSGSGALEELRVTWASRTGRPDGKTSPEELIAAAHASCFAMALSLVLAENHTPPERLVVSAACTLDEVDGAPKVTASQLSVRARVKGDRVGRLRTAGRARRSALPGLKRAARERRDQRAGRTRRLMPIATTRRPRRYARWPNDGEHHRRDERRVSSISGEP
jgi:osmotically inducible protein OsmC